MERIVDKETKDDDEGQPGEKRNQVGSEVLEIRTIDEEMRDPDQNPKKVFLRHAEEFARQNLDKDMLVIEPYDILVDDMVAIKLYNKESVFAEYEPVSLEYAFRVKNREKLKDLTLPSVISTKDAFGGPCGRKEFAKEVMAKLMHSMLANFISTKTILGKRDTRKPTTMAQSKLSDSSLTKLNGIVEGYKVIDVKQNVEILFVQGRQLMLIKTWEKVRHED